MLAEKKPETPNPKIAKALETIMVKNGDMHFAPRRPWRLKNWSTPESVPVLIKVTVSDKWPPVKSLAIEALCEYTPKEAIKPVAQQMINMQTRHSAVKFLKAVGPDAEDAVLALVEHKDPWVRAAVCELLDEFGTKKSLPALEKAIADDNWMVNGNARKAVAAIKSREEINAVK